MPNLIVGDSPKLYLSRREALQLIEGLAKATVECEDRAGHFCPVTLNVTAEREGNSNQFGSSLVFTVTK